MVSLHTRVDAANDLAAVTGHSAISSSAANSFAQQLATALEGALNQAGSGSSLNVQVSPVSGRDSGGSQFLVTLTPESAATPTNTVAPTLTGSAGTAANAASSGASGSTAAQTPGYGTIEGLFSGAGVPASTNTTAAAAASTAPAETELQAYWAAQPPAVQALQNMPVGAARTALAQSLENQGYPIDYEIMVEGWDPQITMTARQEDGYTWVPSMGQPAVLVAPGVSDPGVINTYNADSPPPGSILVSTAFANGMIQSPDVPQSASA